jgi:protein O-mannosyl-transferase
VDYGRTPARVMQQQWGWFATVVPVALALLAFRFRRQHPMLLLSLAIFIIGILPVLGFVPFLFQIFSGVTDHYVYISMLGPAMLAGYLGTFAPIRAMAIAGVTLLLVLSILTYRQTRVWKDDISLWTQALKVNPESYLALSNRGAAWFRRGNLGMAEADFRAALALNPDYPDVQFNFGLVLARTGKSDEAMSHFRRALELQPAMEEARIEIRRLSPTTAVN